MIKGNRDQVKANMASSLKTYTEQFDEAFEKAFKEACHAYGTYESFSEFVKVFATEIALASGNSVPQLLEAKETIFRSIAELRKESYQAMYLAMIDSFTSKPDQDFLGSMYMKLGIGDKAHGQYFTPFAISELLASLKIEHIVKAIDKKGYATIYEPTCGSGGMIIAIASELYRRGYNYQEQLYFEAHELAELPALMCYLQCSLLGLAGHLVIGDTLEFESRMVLQTPIMLTGLWQIRQMNNELPWPTDLYRQRPPIER